METPPCFMLQLIQHTSAHNDQELCQSLPCLRGLLMDSYNSITSLPSGDCEELREEGPDSDIEVNQESSTQHLPMSPPQQHSQIGQMETRETAIRTTDLPGPSRLESEREEEERRTDSSRQTGLQRASRGETKPGYPTNNMLACFKGPHLKFLKKKLGSQLVDSFQVVKDIANKNGITMNDFQFKDALREFFGNKVHYRELMISKCSLKSRKVYMRKLVVLEKAFNTQTFNWIN